MTNFVEALRTKLSELQDEQEELQDALSRVSSKIELLTELLTEETVDIPVEKPPIGQKKRSKKVTSKKVVSKRGRKKKVDAVQEEALQEEYLEALTSLPRGVKPTTLVEQKAAVKRFKPVPRTSQNYGGVRSGGKVEEVLLGQDEPIKTNARISIEDE